MKKLAFIILFLAIGLAGCGGGDITELMSEGNQYMTEHNYQGAIVIFKTVLEKAPEKMEARLALGRAYLAVGKLDQADKEFGKYLRQNPYDTDVLLDMAELKGQQKEYDASIEYLNKYLEKEPKSARAHEMLGIDYAAQGKLDPAFHEFRTAVDLAPDLVSAKINLAKAYLNENDLDKAGELIDAVLAKDPDNHVGLYMKARLAAQRGDNDTTFAAFSRIAERYPDDANARYALGKIYVSRKDFKKAGDLAAELTKQFPKRPEGEKLNGLIAYAQKDYNKAINDYHQALSKSPDTESSFFLGLSYYGKGDLETAISHLRMAADYGKDFDKAREMIALILYQQGRLDESIVEANKLLKGNTPNAFAHTILGDVYTAKGETEKALQEYKTASAGSPDPMNLFLKMGSLYASMGELGKTEDAFKQAMAAAPTDLKTRVVLASFYMRRNEPDMARQTLNEGLTGKATDVVLYDLLARMAIREKKIDRAKELFTKGKEVAPSSPSPYMSLASIALAERKPDEALRQFNELLAVRKDYLRAWLGKAAIQETQGDNAGAAETYRELLAIGSPTAITSYAAYRIKNGDLDGALKVLDDGLKTHPHEDSLVGMKADTLLLMKRYDDIYALCDEFEKFNRGMALNLRTRALIVEKQYEKAVNSARQLIDFQPQHPFGYLTLEEIYLRSGQPDKAKAILQDGLNATDHNPQLLVALGMFHAGQKEYEKALSYVDAAIKRNGQSYQAYSAKGEIASMAGMKDLAKESYQKALSLNSHDVATLNNLAMLYLDDKDTRKEALRYAYTAFLMAPGSGPVMDTFGYALAVNERGKEAVKVLNQAMTLSENPVIKYHLGYTYYTLGDKDKALTLLNDALKGLKGPEAGDARKLIDTIKKS